MSLRRSGNQAVFRGRITQSKAKDGRALFLLALFFSFWLSALAFGALSLLSFFFFGAALAGGISYSLLL